MSIWVKISEAISALAAGESLSSILEKLQTPPEKSLAFTIAVIGLGAKMAKADGVVTRDEVSAFRQFFQVAKKDEKEAARVFNLARQDVAGYEVYAQKIAKMFDKDSDILADLLEGLFYIAMADGRYHPAEDDYVHQVSQIFEVDDVTYRSFKTRFIPDHPPDAYQVLGVSPDMSYDEIHDVWRQKIRETHPDVMIAHGLPEEAVKLATRRMIAINKAWDEICDIHEDA
ncbi:molecular chaperone DjiA [Amylibacter sp. SFDW26]|uniref:molecular chaperone DjiA n=1 Tax=Amylibacter sp. SFDW26 TaxID=2652722 RepID=UPI0012616DB7|nr:molecular chaperone DjiA [Amylibacter sp. SFDW26]KAB7615361.1 molecular chaperone DjiA [Amylibacter sp. SFDW26]